jgi:hypothetical protein
MTAKRGPTKRQDPTGTRILIDTSVWLDVAKDYRQQTLLSALEELTKRGIVVLLVPDIVREEFARNKARIIEDSRRIWTPCSGRSSVLRLCKSDRVDAVFSR